MVDAVTGRASRLATLSICTIPCYYIVLLAVHDDRSACCIMQGVWHSDHGGLGLTRSFPSCRQRPATRIAVCREGPSRGIYSASSPLVAQGQRKTWQLSFARISARPTRTPRSRFLGGWSVAQGTRRSPSFRLAALSGRVRGHGRGGFW